MFYFLTGINLRHHIKTDNADASVKSDHKIVTITFNLDSEEWGRGYWKLNSDILLNNDYKANIKKVINDFLHTNPEGHVSPHILWESLKCVVTGETIKCCALKKKRLIQQRLSREAKLAIMKSRLINCDPADKNAVLSSINTTKNDLDKLIENSAKGAAVRSRARWTEYGDKIPSIFLA